MQAIPTPSLAGESSRHSRARPSLPAVFLLLPLFLFGCREPKVASYRVPKEAATELPATAPVHGSGQVTPAAPETAPPQMAASATASAPDTHGLQTASGTSLTWKAPASWQTKAASTMRKATFVITGDGGTSAELAVTAFPGDVGGEIANVNRWRGQVGLPPVSDADASAGITRLEGNGLKIGVVDIGDPSAANGTRLLGAMVPHDGATWFFKLMGPDTVVAKEKALFFEFLQTVKPATP